jgi:alkanesulfonate monooxygenase SsuD/methylene tetrahydromethanopterin reductase-like flavin-dependent oxidoreductase (luciferase family)
MSSSPRKLRRRDDTMRFGVFWPYSRTLIPSETIAKNNPDVLDLQNHVRLAQQAEAAGLDFALIADGYAPASAENSRVGFQDPSTNAVILAVPLMMATSRLGIISTMHTKFLHPVVIARLGAHLDWISNGRWGWNVVNGFRPHEARLFGVDGKIDHDDGYDLADEAVRIIKAIWDPEGKDVQHEGRYFKVEGRIRRPVPPTTPLLVSAASSERGRVFATAHCDYLFATPLDAKDAQDIQNDLSRHAAATGKTETPQILILCDLFVRDETGRAREEYEALLNSTDPAAQKIWSSHLDRIAHTGRKGGDVMGFVGTPAEIAEQIITLRRDTGITGLMFRLPLWGPDEAARIGPVLEQLRRAGAWKPPAEREYCW